MRSYGLRRDPLTGLHASRASRNRGRFASLTPTTRGIKPILLSFFLSCSRERAEHSLSFARSEIRQNAKKADVARRTYSSSLSFSEKICKGANKDNVCSSHMCSLSLSLFRSVKNLRTCEKRLTYIRHTYFLPLSPSFSV